MQSVPQSPPRLVLANPRDITTSEGVKFATPSVMRITSQQPGETPPEIPLEVQLWIQRGWTVMDTQRQGIVLSGQKEMRGRSKFLIVAGIILLCLFKFGVRWPILGGLLLVLAWLDYRFLTKPPTKFFPAEGEKTRTLDR
jgi:hypothetical protein